MATLSPQKELSSPLWESKAKGEREKGSKRARESESKGKEEREQGALVAWEEITSDPFLPALIRVCGGMRGGEGRGGGERERK